MSKPQPRFEWRQQYDLTADEREGKAAGLKCEDESLTQQSFTEDADLNVIAKRYGLNDIPSAPLDPAFFRDTTEDPDLRTILEYQRAARDSFLSLPARLRKRFHNSPEELWEFVNDPQNADEAVRLGLLTRPDTATADLDKTAADATTKPESASTAPSAKSTTSSSAGDGTPSQK